MAYFDHFATGRSTAIGDWLGRHAIEQQFRFLRAHLPVEGRPEILEIGPGHGEFAARLMAAGYRNYDVVEPNATLRAKLEALGIRSAKTYRIPDLHEKDESYDAVVICDVFEHLNDAREAQRFVAEAKRVLRKGGILFILSPDLMDWKEDFYNCDFSHSNPTTVRRTHEMFLNEDLATIDYCYAYSGFQGGIGFLLSRVVKALTFWASGEDLDFKPYKLRLTFLRRFMIVGKKGDAVNERGEVRRMLRHNAIAHDQVAGSYDDKHVEIFNAVEQERLANTVSELVRLAGMPLPSVLDVGAGTGNLSLKFLSAGCRVCAADVSARSLEQLVRKAPAGSPVSTSLLADDRLPFPDASFDIAGTYSVLHHVPDYLATVREMVRVIRPGGFVYIDHEASDRSWSADPVLEEYRSLTRLSPWRHLWALVRSGEAFTMSFAKTAFMKAFVDRRYEREGDLHVWPDDHIEWPKIEAVLAEEGATVICRKEYLHYHPRGGPELFDRYRDRCSDMQYLFARKRG